MARIFWGAYDAVSASIVDEGGGDGIWLSGLCCSAVAGLPDTELAGLGDLLSCLRAVRRATELPVWVDCGTGFGSPANLAVAADDLRRAGAGGICVEDKIFPKRNTFTPVEQFLEDVPAFCRKIEQARKRLDGSGCLVVARTEALSVGESPDAALRRASASSAPRPRWAIPSRWKPWTRPRRSPGPTGSAAPRCSARGTSAT